jgi:hypothetical protein
MMHAGMGAARIVHQDFGRHGQLPGHKRYGFWWSAGEIVREKPHEAQRTQFQGKPEARVWPCMDWNLLLIGRRQRKKRDQVLISKGSRKTVSALTLSDGQQLNRHAILPVEQNGRFVRRLTSKNPLDYPREFP